jgi:Double zinc ribbon
MTPPRLLISIHRKEKTRMEFNKNAPAIVAGSTTVGAAVSSAGEVDLYDELIAFAGLTPEEQLRLLARPQEPLEEAVESQNSDSVSTQDTTSSVEIQATEPETETISETDDSIGASEVSSEASEDSSPSGALAVPSLPAAQSPTGSEDSPAIGETSDVSPQLYDYSRTGPLLAGLNVIPEFVFSGDLSLGVCLACGAESGADDLFCLVCGVFIDDIGSTPKSNPTCGECGQSVTADEIFCPWCGAAPG